MNCFNSINAPDTHNQQNQHDLQWLFVVNFIYVIWYVLNLKSTEYYLYFIYTFKLAFALINLAKRGYCNAGVCLSVYLCVRSSDTSFITVPIVAKLDMGVAGYDAYIVEKYHWNKGQGQRTCEKHIIIDNSGTTHHRNVK